MTQDPDSLANLHPSAPEPAVEDSEHSPVPADAPAAVSPGAQDWLAWEQAHPQDPPAENFIPIESRPSGLQSLLKSISLSLSTSLVAILLAGAATMLILALASRVLPANEPVSPTWIERLVQFVDAQFDRLEQQVGAVRNQPLDMDKVSEHGHKIASPGGSPSSPSETIGWLKALNERAEKITAWIEELKERTPSYNEILEWLRQKWEQLTGSE